MRPPQSIDDARILAVAERVIDRGHKIADGNRGVFRLGGEGVALAVDLAAADAAACQDAAVDARPVIAAGGLIGIERWRAAELPGPGHQRRLEQATLGKVPQ